MASDQDPAPVTPPPPPPDPDRAARLAEVAASLRGQIIAGEVIDENELLARHADLMPELREELAKTRRVFLAMASAEEIERTSPRIEGYVIVRRIGGGGQAVVYEAVRSLNGDRVAIKLMKEGPLASPQVRARFEREAKILAALDHPGIVKVVDQGATADGFDYLVMPFIDGLPPDAFLRAKESGRATDAAPDRTEALRLMVKICRAVNAAHQQGVIHRDLKPSNILIDTDGTPHVLDFGMARTALPDMTDEDEPQRVTMTGQFLGSLQWASPEQAAGQSSRIDIRTDVYSLGVILYHMITGGRFPYEVMGAMRDVLNNIVNAEPLPPSESLARHDAALARGKFRYRRRHRADVNAAIEAIVMKALAKRREDRYQSAGELAADIENYLAGRPIVAMGFARRSLWPRLRVAGVACVALAGIIAMAWYVLVSPGDDTRPITSPDPIPVAANPRVPPSPSTGRTSSVPSVAAGPRLTESEAIARLAPFATIERNAQGSAVKVTITSSVFKDEDLAPLRDLPYLREFASAGKYNPMSDRALAYLSGKPSLAIINIGDVPYVTDAGLKHLAGLPKLLQLGLGSVHVGDAGVAHLRDLPKLYIVNLGGTEITDDGLDFVANLPSMISLVVSTTVVSDRGLDRLANIPKFRESASELYIGLTRVTPAGIAKLHRFPNLKVLGLESLPITDADVASLAKLPKLQHLRLDHTALTDAGLSQMVRQLPDLRVLRIGHTRLADAAMGPLAQARQLRELNLANTNITDEGLRDLCASTSLEVLDLTQTHVTDDGLVQYVPRIKSLQRLHIAPFERVTVAGITRLHDTCPRLTISLLEMPVGGIGIAPIVNLDSKTSEEEKAITQLSRFGAIERDANGIAIKATFSGDAFTDDDLEPLRRLPHLKEFTASGRKCRLTDRTLALLSEIKSLEVLHLDGLPNITDDGVAHLSKLTNLTALDLKFTPVSDSGIRHLKSLTNLRLLIVAGTNITDNAVDIAAHMPYLGCFAFSQTAISDRGLERLSLMPSAQMSIWQLDPGNTRITVDGLKVLPRFSGLTLLHLGGMALEDKDLAIFKSVPSLRVFGLQQTKITDVGIEHLVRDFPEIHILYLDDTSITDKALAAIEPVTSIKILGLRRTNITDVGLAKIAKLPNLNDISLPGTRVTDDGLLQHIPRMLVLNRLEASIGGGVTQTGILKLRKACPQVAITAFGMPAPNAPVAAPAPGVPGTSSGSAVQSATAPAVSAPPLSLDEPVVLRLASGWWTGSNLDAAAFVAPNPDTSANANATCVGLRRDGKDGQAFVYSSHLNGVRLADLTALAFDVYVSKASTAAPGCEPFVNIYLDTDDDGMSDITLASMPSAGPPRGQWFQLKALDHSWRYRRRDKGAQWSAQMPFTAIVSELPGARIVADKMLGYSIGAMRIVAGVTGQEWEGFQGYIDNIQIGVSGKTVTHQLRPTDSPWALRSGAGAATKSWAAVATGGATVGMGPSPGSGLLMQTLPENGKSYLGTSLFHGVRLVDITALDFEVNIGPTSKAAPAARPYINLQVDLDGDGKGDAVLAEAFNISGSPLDRNVWHRISAPELRWRVILRDEARSKEESWNQTTTLREIVGKFPRAQLASGDPIEGSIGFPWCIGIMVGATTAKPGDPWSEFSGRVDHIRIGVRGQETKIDLRPAVVDIVNPPKPNEPRP